MLEQSVPFRIDSAESLIPDRGSTYHSGDRIDSYRVVELLRAGGMGEVYLAEAEQPVKRRVALKIIKLGMDTREIVARFESERQALAIMSHPNIARVYDAGTTVDGRPFFVMEHVPGVPITEYCDTHRLVTRDRLALFMPVCDAVQHAHHKSIIHRDIKPSNVLLMLQDGHPTPKIIDFGISKALDQRLTEKSIYTELGQMIGTPEYMSPEQAETGSLDIDTRTDIYSLGVLLYELLSGNLPFTSETLREASYGEIQRVIREVDPPRPSARLTTNLVDTEHSARQRGTDARGLVHQLRGELDWIAMKALDKDRKRRYSSASEFAADVERFLNFEPIVAGPPTALYRVQKFCRRYRTALVASGFVVILLATIALSTWYVLKKDYEKQRREQSTDSLRLGDIALQTYVDKWGEISKLETIWHKAELENKTYEPVWNRDAELTSWRTWTNTRDEVHRFFDEARNYYIEAEKLALEGSSEEHAARFALEKLLHERMREATISGEIARKPEFFKSMIDALGLGTYDGELAGNKELIIRSDPPGAEIFCFRFREHEMRLLPLPFSPSAGLERPEQGFTSAPYLEIESLSDLSDDSPFQRGDRVLTVNETKVSTRTDLARALRDVGSTKAVAVTVQRDGMERTFDWVPFPTDRVYDDPEGPGRVFLFWKELGLFLSGYPLDPRDDCRLGVTDSEALRVTLSPGSHLLLLRKPGYEDARLCVQIPDHGGEHRIPLFKSNAAPEGFVYIPPGPVEYGGDLKAFQARERGSKHVEGSFMSRLEVTTKEYLKYLNSKELLPTIAHEQFDEKGNRLDGYGRTELIFSETVRGIAERVNKRHGVRVVPRTSERSWDRSNQRWTTVWSAERPVSRITQLAALEYAAWRSRNSKRWQFRLPDDDQWEKAARGADRRTYVWGNYLIPNFCWSYNAFPDPIASRDLVGNAFTTDESVYGVRDLAGSLREFTTSKATDRYSYISLRGGKFRTTDEYEFRVATRNGLRPDQADSKLGIRLIAVPKENKP